MRVLKPVASFVPRVSHFHFHLDFNFNFKLGAKTLLSSRSRSLFVVLWLRDHYHDTVAGSMSYHLTMANDERKRRRHLGTWHLIIIIGHHFPFSPFCGVECATTISCHWHSFNELQFDAHTHSLPLSLWLVGSAKKKCREECGVR